MWGYRGHVLIKTLFCDRDSKEPLRWQKQNFTIVCTVEMLKSELRLNPLFRIIKFNLQLRYYTIQA